MKEVGIIQFGDPILTTEARRFDLPSEAENARRVVAELASTVEGKTRIVTFDRGTARLVAHEVDHLYGLLYPVRMRPGIEPIPVSRHKGNGRQWSYEAKA